jgi:hypothetical protein
MGLCAAMVFDCDITSDPEIIIYKVGRFLPGLPLDEPRKSGHACTTGAGCFAEGPRLSAKSLRLSAKSLPSAALGENPIGKGFFAESRIQRSAKHEIKKIRKKPKFFLSGEGPTGQRSFF